jgi:transposase
MPIQSKVDRHQMQLLTLDTLVDKTSIVRIIDLFCSCIDYENLGFTIKGKSHEGKPAFETSTLTAIYIYGYLNKIRSCRLLDKACKVNSELWWLTGMQKPCYKTISNFRKNNADAFKNLFKSFSKFCLELELYGKTTVAIDGSKFRALNSKKNNYNIKKINQHLDYIAQQKQDYLQSLDANDEADNKLTDLKDRESKYLSLKKELELSDEKQISTTDPDARALPLKMSIVEVAYNLQSVVDDKHNLIVDYQVTNKNDFSALAPLSEMAKRTLEIKENEKLTVLADKGYYSGEQIAACHDNDIDTLVSPKSKGSKSKDPRVSKAKFDYNKEKDIYTCPKAVTLHRQGKTYTRHDGIPFKRYVAHWTDCKQCPWKNICVSPGSQKAARGRMLNRNIYEDHMDRNDAQVAARKNEYRRRQAIVEHPFGTIKRQWGFTHTNLKGLKKVNGEFGLILLCYNLKRVLSILGVNGLKKTLNRIRNMFTGMLASIKHQIEIHFTQRHKPSQSFSYF